MAPAPEQMAVKAMPDAMTPSLHSVIRTSRDTADTFTLELGPSESGEPFRFAPGQFNMIYQFGVGEVPISISGDCEKTDRIVHTIRNVGTVTKALSKLKKGDKVGLRGPFGTSWPIDQAEGNDLVLIAGGIGLAPLRPVLYSILFRRRKFGRVVLLYGTRSPLDVLFKKELQKWRARFDLEIEVSVDRAIVPWRGNVGVVTSLIPRATFDPLHTTAMLCGPEIMMRFSILELRKLGVIEDNIYVSLERSMKCGCGFCGHCQCGKYFVCKDGPVFAYPDVKNLLSIREI